MPVKYVDIKLSLIDKIRLLFLGIIPENKLPVVEKIKEVPITKETIKEYHFGPENKSNINKRISTQTEDFSMPFFVDDEDTKSNL